MELRIKQSFDWAHRGCDIVRYEAEQTVKTDDADLVRVACAEGWAELVGEKAAKPAANKALKGAPENK